MSRRVLVAVLAVVLGGLAAACDGAAPRRVTASPGPVDTEAQAPAATTPAPPALEVDQLRVVATVAPIADLVARVLGDRGRVDALIPPGADAHTYEPRPRDVGLLSELDLFVGVGLGLNEASVRLAETNVPPGTPIVLLGEEALDAEHLVLDHRHSHSHSHSHDEQDHAHDDAEGAPNPHTWTSVQLAMAKVGHLAAVLSEVDPEGATIYRRNANALLLELRALDEAIAAAVETIPQAHRKLVTYHDAWSYFGRDYGLEVVAAVQPSDFSEPSAGDVRAIIDQIRAEGVPAVFGSEVFASDVLHAIADETGAAFVGELADDELPGSPGDRVHSYVGLMATNARVVVEALGGDPSPLAAFPG